MKLSGATSIIALFAALGGAKADWRDRQRCYGAKGEGFQSVIVEDDGFVQVGLRITDPGKVEGDATASTEWSYHLHVGWAGSDEVFNGSIVNGSTSVDLCSPANTGGHYDPTRECGKASAAPDVECILKWGTAINPDYGKADYGPNYAKSPNDPLDPLVNPAKICEFGDLSCRTSKVNEGAPTVTSFYLDSFTKDYVREAEPDKDYRWDDSLSFSPSEWSSIVLHSSGELGNTAGTRVACAAYVPITCSSANHMLFGGDYGPPTTNRKLRGSARINAN